MRMLISKLLLIFIVAILVYRTPSYVVIYRSYTLLNMVRFLAHPVHAYVYFLPIFNIITL